MSELSRRGAIGTFLTAIFGGPSAAKEIAAASEGLGGLMLSQTLNPYKDNFPKAQMVEEDQHDYVSERIKELKEVIAGKYYNREKEMIYTGERMQNVKYNLKALKSTSRAWKSMTYHAKRDQLNEKQQVLNARREILRYLGLQSAGIKNADSHEAYMWDKQNNGKKIRFNYSGHDTATEASPTGGSSW